MSTPFGRLQLRYAAWHRAGPLLYALTRVYRRTLLRSTRVIAVVGSFGKTTTSRAVLAALGGRPPRRMDPNSGGWVARSVFRLRPGQQHAVIEVGINGPGQMAGYARLLRPDVVVVTSVGSEHGRSLGTLERTRDEKAEMVRRLPRSGCAVLNGDDAHVLWMRTQTSARVVTFGFAEGNTVRAENPQLDWPHGTRLTVHTPQGTRVFQTRLIGRPMIYSLLAATAVGLNEGIPLDDLVASLARLDPTPGRLERVSLANGAIVLRDDFKGHLETTEAALDVLAQIPARRRIIVLGEVEEPPGNQTAIYRHLGEKAAQVGSLVIFVASRRKLPVYRSGARRRGLTEANMPKSHRRPRTVVDALRQARLGPQDVVLIKGRSTQMLERVALALQGRVVRCELGSCDAHLTGCGECPMLERGWGHQGRSTRRQDTETSGP